MTDHPQDQSDAQEEPVGVPYERVLVTGSEIRQAAGHLAQVINGNVVREETVLIAVAEGGLPFAKCISRHLPSHKTGKVWAKSYVGTEQSDEVEISKYVGDSFEGKHVVLLDDIYDTGNTLGALTEHFLSQGATSVEAVVLLNKKVEKAFTGIEVTAGFDIPDLFVVGFGLDLDGDFRNIDNILVISKGN